MMIGGPLMIFGSCHVSGLLGFVPRLVQAPMGCLGKGSVLAALTFLFAGHALCDYPLQGQFLSDAKNRHKNVGEHWMRALFAHSIIHAGMVLAITGSLLCAVLELVIHAITDYAKCEGWINSTQDQTIHYTCKIIWAVLSCGA